MQNPYCPSLILGKMWGDITWQMGYRSYILIYREIDPPLLFLKIQLNLCKFVIERSHVTRRKRWFGQEHILSFWYILEACVQNLSRMLDDNDWSDLKNYAYMKEIKNKICLPTMFCCITTRFVLGWYVSAEKIAIFRLRYYPLINAESFQ